MNATSKLLEVTDLTVAFQTEGRTVTAVDRVSFHLSPGETLGIVGESGCGKTVTARALMRLLPEPVGRIAGGSVKLDGEELSTASEKRLRQVRGARIAMIFQEPMTALNPVFTVGYQIMEAIAAHKKTTRAERKKAAIEMLERVGIPAAKDRVDEYPHQMSGGMRQRVMIAMALALDPQILIADEPTTALDVTVQAQILELIKNLQRERQTAVMLITHDLGVVAETCDRVLVMYAGQVVEEAPTDLLFRRARHPYTRGLLRSLPRGAAGKAQALFAIPGMVPSLHQLPPACRFHPRCDRVEERCRTEAPALVATTDAPQPVRCHFPVDEEVRP